MHSRGKSLTPESSVLMDESRSCSDDWREDTDDDSEAAIVLSLELNEVVERGCCLQSVAGGVSFSR